MPSIRSLFALALITLAATGCPTNRVTDDDDSGSGEPLEVSFSTLEFAHTYPTSPGPTEAGTVRFVNRTDSAATYAVDFGDALIEAYDAGGAVVTGGTLEPGEALTLSVGFNCGACLPEGLSTTATASLSIDLEEVTDSAEVTGTFLGCP